MHFRNSQNNPIWPPAMLPALPDRCRIRAQLLSTATPLLQHPGGGRGEPLWSLQPPSVPCTAAGSLQQGTGTAPGAEAPAALLLQRSGSKGQGSAGCEGSGPRSHRHLLLIPMEGPHGWGKVQLLVQPPGKTRALVKFKSWSCSPAVQGPSQQDPRSRSTQVSASADVCPKAAHSRGQLCPQRPPAPREPFQAAPLPHCPTVATLQPQLSKTMPGCCPRCPRLAERTRVKRQCCLLGRNGSKARDRQGQH